MDEIKLRLNNNQSQPKKFKFLLCPYCWKRIPLLTLIQKEKQFYLNINCFCLKDIHQIELSSFLQQLSLKSKSALTANCTYSSSHEPNSKSTQFCINCQKWLCNACLTTHQSNTNNHHHCIISKELTLAIDCNTHEAKPEKINIANKLLNQTICSKCNSLLHIKEIPNKAIDDFSLVKVNYESTSIIQQDLFAKVDQSMKHNAELKDTIIQLIQEKINKLGTIKDKIIKHYEINMGINEQMKRLLSYVCGTYETLKNSNEIYDKCILLKKNISYFKYNSECNVDIDEKKIENSSRLVLKHFKHSYILQTNLIDEVLTGHNNKVLSIIQLSNDQLASGSLDSTIRIWDLNKVKCIKTLQTEQQQQQNQRAKEGVTKLMHLAPSLLVSGYTNGEIDLWNLTTYSITQSFKEHEANITGLIKITDTKFASCSSDCCIKIWSTAQSQSKSLMSIKAHKDEISSMLLLKNQRLITSSFDSTIKFWNSSEMRITYMLNAHRFPIFCLTQLKTDVIASGSFMEIKIWNINTKICLGLIESLSNNITLLQRVDDTSFASVSTDQLIRIWDVNRLICNRVLESHCGNILELKCLRGIYCFASGTDSNSIELFKRGKKDGNSNVIISTSSKSSTSNNNTTDCVIY